MPRRTVRTFLTAASSASMHMTTPQLVAMSAGESLLYEAHIIRMDNAEHSVKMAGF